MASNNRLSAELIEVLNGYTQKFGEATVQLLRLVSSTRMPVDHDDLDSLVSLIDDARCLCVVLVVPFPDGVAISDDELASLDRALRNYGDVFTDVDRVIDRATRAVQSHQSLKPLIEAFEKTLESHIAPIDEIVNGVSE